jgi:hypothetical protein
MKASAKLLSIASAAALLASLGGPASAQTQHSYRTRPHYCSRNAISNTDPASGTNAATLGITTSISSNTPNGSAPPVSPNTPANTNASTINSNNPGVHRKGDACAVRHTRHRRHQA